jgi:type IV pilus assembly protein PilM
MLSFHRWWGRTTIPVVGVDISASGVRVMELALSGRHVQIAHYAYQRLPPGAIREGSVVMRDAVCDALRDALRESGSRLRHAALALPASAVIKKTLSLPAQSTEDELEMHVEAEAMALLPVAREEIGVDFAVMGPSAQQVDAVDVMLVAARQEKISERAELALSVGLRPQIIDVESQALMSAIGLMVRSSDPTADRLLGVIQIENDQVHAYFMQGEALVFERHLGSLLARKEAGAVESICQEFNRAFQLSQTSAGQASLHHIYLLGPVPADLQSALAQRMSVAVSALDPWQQLAVKPGVMSDNQEHPSACMLVCGLALRSFD